MSARPVNKFSPRTNRALALLVFVAFALAAASVFAVEGESAATGPSTRGAESYQALVDLIAKAPARQVGMPGNDVIDSMVKAKFEAVVKANNDPSKQASAAAAIAAAEAALQNYWDVRSTRTTLPNGETKDPDKDAVLAAAVASLTAQRSAAASLAGLWQTGRVSHPTAAFIPGSAKLSTSDGNTARIYQMAPNLVEAANLPAEGVKGALVYVGRGTPSELAGKPLKGAIALMEFKSDRNWLDAVQFGAVAVVFIEPTSSDLFMEAAKKTTQSLLGVPRFYIKRSDLAESLGDRWREKLAAGEVVTLTQEPGIWRRQEVHSDWLFIPGSVAPKPFGTPIEDDPGRQVIHLQTYKDASSIVPELSPGATSAANILLMFDLVDLLQKNRPERPVLISVVNDHCNALTGEQEFDSAALAPAAAVEPELNDLTNNYIREKFTESIFRQAPNSVLTESLRTLNETVAGQSTVVKDPLIERLSRERNIMREERTRIISRQVLAARAKKEGKPSPIDAETLAKEDAREKEIARLSADLVALQQLLVKFGYKTTFDQLTPVQLQRLKDAFQSVADTSATASAELYAARKRQISNLAIRRRLLWLSDDPTAKTPETTTDAFNAQHPPVPALLALTLDVGFGSGRLGFFYFGNLAHTENNAEQPKNRVYRFSGYSLKLAGEYETQTGKPNLLEDTIRGAKGLPWNAHTGSRQAFAAAPLHALKVAGLTLASVRDARVADYSPKDLPENIDPEVYERVMAFCRDYLPRLIAGPDLASMKTTVGESLAFTATGNVRLSDDFTILVPKQPIPNALVVAAVKTDDASAQVLMQGQVRPLPILMADLNGTVVFRGAIVRNTPPLCFGYDETFRHLKYALDFGDGERRFPSLFNAAKGQYTASKFLIGNLFEKIDLVGLSTATSLNPITDISPIDAQTEAAPRKFSAAGVRTTKDVPLALDGTGSLMVRPGDPFKLKFAENLAINANEDYPQGRGFESDIGRLSNLVLTSTQDMWQLTDQRIQLLTDKGVKDDTAIRFNQRAGELMKEAIADLNKGANDKALVAAEQARGFGYQSYTRAIGTINDLIKAVVLFLALVIPFCFFTTKLITPFTDINRQLAIFCGVFVLMAVLLRFLHPAFEVAQTPAVVILAFVILGLSVFVSSVLIGRFNSSMTQAIEESMQAESVEAPQSRLAGVAFLVGVNNMRRRRIRTSLTCATVVLVTFTMLSVISVGQDLEPAMVRNSAEPVYSGFMFAQPGLSEIKPRQMLRLRAHFAPNATVVSRVWAQKQGANREYLSYYLRPAGSVGGTDDKMLETKVIVGLETAEEGFLQPMPLVPGGRWFSSNDANEIVLSRKAAELLGITSDNMLGKEIEVNGRRLRLIGLLDDEALEKMRDLADVPLLPMLEAPMAQPAPGQQATKSSADVDLAGSLTGGPGTQIARTVDVAFVPIGVAIGSGDGTYRSLSVKYNGFKDKDGNIRSDDDAANEAWKSANEFIQFQFARVSLGITKPITKTTDGVARRIDAAQYALASKSGTQFTGFFKVAIPIVLAATIILNTMLGSVMERRREVGIYNAIGLNPGHVMMFFLAESLVFGMVGSVAGYLIGQALSLVLTFFKLPLNLNYSSMSVMVVIFLTIGTVLLSTVYPAMMAARAAVPSGQRRWSLPQPQGDEIHINFPFSYDAGRVVGVCAYLRDYMRQNSEASTGKFLAKLGPVGKVPTPGSGAEHSSGYAMVFDIAPAPFDLGVNQKMEVYAYYDPRVRAHMLAVHLTRTSGERGNWMTVNQPFLEALRKRLLGWRSQKPETHETFFREGQQMFADAADLPAIATAAGGEKA